MATKPPSYIPKDLRLGSLSSNHTRDQSVDAGSYKSVGGNAGGDSDDEERSVGGTPKGATTEKKPMAIPQGVVVLLFWYLNLILTSMIGLGSIYIYLMVLRDPNHATSLLYSIFTLALFSSISLIATLILLISNHLIIKEVGYDGKMEQKPSSLAMVQAGMIGIWAAFGGEIMAMVGLLIDVTTLAGYTCVNPGGTDTGSCVLSKGVLTGISITSLVISFLSALFTVNIFTLLFHCIRDKSRSKNAVRELKAAASAHQPEPFEEQQHLYQERREPLYQEGGQGYGQEYHQSQTYQESVDTREQGLFFER